MGHVAICRVPRYKIFFHIVSLTELFKKKTLMNTNVCFEFLYTFCLKYFSF
jgi:hypothetical protein